MKRLFALFLACFLLLTTAGCGKAETSSADPYEVLVTVWSSYEQPPFAAAGGDGQHIVMDAPGPFDLTDSANADSVLGLPEDMASQVTEAASLLHLMNANTFTAGAFRTSGDSKSLAQAVASHLEHRQWVCGFPDKIAAVSVDTHTAVVVFGNAELVDDFLSRVYQAYESTENVADLEVT